MKLATHMDDHSDRPGPFSARMDIVRSYPSLANRSVSAEATVHDLSDTGFFGTAMLRLARGMQVRIRLPGMGVREAEVAWAEFPNFACVFRDDVAPDAARPARTRGPIQGKSSLALLRAAMGLGSLLFLIALLWSLWT